MVSHNFLLVELGPIFNSMAASLCLKSGSGCNTVSHSGLANVNIRYIVIVIYLPFKHKQTQIILFNCMQKMSTVTS